ncbi:ketohexokinase [Diachasma alloeum]|uniref:ketohexokinase n=1 Tax=Diachasma alloeum TaxID=454923 RepID=UPI0007382ACA|nr:ketohexokinase [Diachasma alloeum]XP_015126330.1 ketohexokinase [Diachasma alloeum]XP_015126331.1 ketohexokinase [Diachasma alloeum]XP_015126332.1 ketohexokinase [Diachasma alloeum]
MISSFYERIVGGSPPPEVNKPKILCVGLTCLDIVQTVNTFPVEDSDTRCSDYRWQLGGNSANNCTVLSLLGSSTEFFGVLGNDYQFHFLQDDMRKHGIDFSHCPRVQGIGCPTSTVILCSNSGSRTIVHYNPNFPELTLEDFEKLNLEDYSWINFEGRNIPRVLTMMQHVETYNDSLKEGESDRSPVTISVELEKMNSELLDLLPYADVAFVSKDFARSRGHDNMSEAIRSIAQDIKSGATIVCAWGDRGAMARTRDGTIVQSPAFPPTKIVDTLGAGDTFVAATIHYLNNIKLRSEKRENKSDICDQVNQSDGGVTRNQNIESLQCSKTAFIDQSALQSAITFGCQTAGIKIGFSGYEDLRLKKNTSNM